MKKNIGSSLLSALFAGCILSAAVTGQSTTTNTPNTQSTTPVSGPASIFTTYDGQTLRKGEYTFSGAYANYDLDVQTLSLNSKLMARAMPYRVILPDGYSDAKNAAVRYPVIYLLHGLFGHYDNWTDKTGLISYAKGHSYIIVTPEGDNGWYTDSVTVPNDKYESYIVKELIPEIDTRYRTVATRDHRVIAGLSMGGYGALKFGLKYPEMFSLIGSFSGALGATSFNEKNAGIIGKGLDAIYGAGDSPTRKANDIFGLVKDLTPDQIKMVPYVYQSCGTEDFLFQNNRDFVTLLEEKKVPHEYREHPGIHNWVFWDDQVREFLDVADRTLKR